MAGASVMVIPEPLIHYLFDHDVDVPVNNLLRVNAPGEVAAKLEEAGLGPAKGKTMVVPVCRIDDGSVTEVTCLLVSKASKAKISSPANLVHPEAPPNFRLTIDRDYHAYRFPPSTNQSEWILASSVGLEFYSSFGRSLESRIVATTEEKNWYGLTDFHVRLALIPTDDPRTVDAVLVAIPVPDHLISSLISPNMAWEGRGYPVLHVNEEQSMSVGPSVPDNGELFGLPCLPFLWFPTPDPDPEPADVLTSVL